MGTRQSWQKRQENRALSMRPIHQQKDHDVEETSILSRVWMQFHQESQAWLRSIEFLRQENSHLKNRLAEVVDMRSDGAFLAQAEHFQNQFIIKDEYLDELRHDVSGQDQMLGTLSEKKERKPHELIREAQRKLRSQMEYLEKDFTFLRNEFNAYLDGCL